MSDEIICRLRIADDYGVNWYDPCYYNTFVCHDGETWSPLIPGFTRIKVPEYSEQWLVISCAFDPEYDNPCLRPSLPDDDCVGQPADESAGSGDGVGSGGFENGVTYDPRTGYSAGYDLPDAGVAGFRHYPDKNSRTGFYIFRPVLGINHEYRYGVMGTNGRGTWANPLKPYDTISIDNVKITEAIIDVTGLTGCLPIYFNSSGECCMSIDVYVDGKRVATTCGPACLAGRLDVCMNKWQSTKAMVRFTRMGSYDECKTDIQIGPEVPDNGGDDGSIIIPPDGGDSGGGTIIPDPDDDFPIGTPIFPYPCSATVRPDWSLLKDNVISYTHYMGTTNGLVNMCVANLSGDIEIDVLYEGNIIGGSYYGIDDDCFSFWYTHNRSEYVQIRITTKGSVPNDWEYTMWCQKEDPDDGGNPPDPDDGNNGSPTYPLSCNKVQSSSGSPIQTHWWTFGYDFLDETYDRSLISIECEPFGDDTIMFMFYDKYGSLIDTYQGAARGGVSFPRIKEAHGDSLDTIQVRVESNIGVSWEYRVNCPLPLLDIKVEGEVIPWTPSAVRP